MTAAEQPHPQPDEPATPHLTVVPGQPGTEVAVRRTTTLRDKLTYADELSKSGLLPAAYRRQPANILFALEFASMLNLSPMAALTGIHVIDGRPTASAALMSAIVRNDGHRLRVTFDAATMSATAELVRRDDPDFTFRTTWNLARAVEAGLCTIKDGKAFSRDSKGRPQPWEKYTPNMLKWRAISEVCRDGAEESLYGLHYTPDELGADVDADGNVLDGEIVREAPQPDIDWDAKIAEIVDDPEALTLLWKSAPRDSEARAKIAAAGSAAAAKRKAAQTVPAAPAAADDDVVDAEIVEDPATPADLAPVAVGLVDALMVLHLPEHVATIVDTDITGKPVGDVDVSGLLRTDDREALGLEDDESLPLRALAAVVLRYVERHNRSPREAGFEL